MSKYPPTPTQRTSFDYAAFMAQDTELSSLDLSPEEMTRVTNDLIALFDNVYDPNLQDPVLYINEAIRKKIEGSSAPQTLKDSINSQTPIIVAYSEGAIMSTPGGTYRPEEFREFKLEDIVTDTYLREFDGLYDTRVIWPTEFPRDLTEALESANLQASYQADVRRRLGTPQAKSLIKLQTMIEVESRLERYADDEKNPAAYRELASAYSRKEAKLRLLEFKKTGDRRKVAQALYLQYPGLQFGGLLIFLGAEEHEAIVPLPETNARQYIESSKQLSRLVLQRLPLYLQLKDGYQRLSYHYYFMGPHVTLMPPLDFRDAEEDVFEELYALKIKRMLSDIDTLVSTDAERLTDKLLEIGGFILHGLAIAVALPSGPGNAVAARLLVSFLMGQGAAALQAIRAANADTPQQAEELYNQALFSAIMEIAGPIAQKLVGRALSKVAKAEVTKKVFRYMRKSRPYPGKPPIRATSVTLSTTEIRRVKAKLISELTQGPKQAQAMVKRSLHMLKRHVDGHDVVICRGKVFRGDMRPPEEIFEQGFKLRTPASELQKDIHQATGVRGGFGGGHNALDPDGRGISTSAYYNDSGAGAYFYGGHKGGYTYLIDGRKLTGYHLYQNHHNALIPDIEKRLRMRPLEINYAENIPSNAVLGAYDPKGIFIPNNIALRRLACELCYIKANERIAMAAAAAAAMAGGKLAKGEDA